MDPSTISLLAQFPLLGAFIWWSLHRDKLAAEERAQRDSSWQDILTRAEEYHVRIAENHVDVLKEIAREHRLMEERILKGQNEIRRDTTKISVLLISRMTNLDPEKARAFVKEVMHD